MEDKWVEMKDAVKRSEIVKMDVCAGAVLKMFEEAWARKGRFRKLAEWGRGWRNRIALGRWRGRE